MSIQVDRIAELPLDIDKTQLPELNQPYEDYLRQLLTQVDDDRKSNGDTLHKEALSNGLQIMLGSSIVPDTEEWRDLVDFSKAVIVSPKDDHSRIDAVWTRSCSPTSRELLSRYGPETVNAAETGLASLVSKYFGGESDKIPHINKKENFLRVVKKQTPGKAYYPPHSPLAVITYETGNVACSLGMLAFCSLEQASMLGMLTHHAICDDYSEFTSDEVELRVRIVALGVGAAHNLGEHGASAVLDGTLLQARGTGTDKSIYSTMAWRAISGCSTPYSGTHFKPMSPDEAVAPPMVMTAVHDLFDWRSDTAAGQHENSVMAAYGLGFGEGKNVFHTFLEALLELVVRYPSATIPHAAGVTFMHYFGSRYGSYDYRGSHGPPCEKCVGMLRQATLAANMEWRPLVPPRSFAEASPARDEVKKFIDDQKDTGMLQEGLGWFQHLISTGEIWLFDLLSDGVKPVDSNAEWI